MTENVTCFEIVKLSSSISKDAVKLMFSTSFKSFALCRNIVKLHKSCRFSSSLDFDTLINSCTLPSIGKRVNPYYIKRHKHLVVTLPPLTMVQVLPFDQHCWSDLEQDVAFSNFFFIYIHLYKKLMNHADIIISFSFKLFIPRIVWHIT